MLNENYLIWLDWMDAIILAAGRTYAFLVLAKMLGEIKINKTLYRLAGCILTITSAFSILSDKSIELLFLLGMIDNWIILKVVYRSSVLQRWIIAVAYVASVVVAESIVYGFIYTVYYIEIVPNALMLRMLQTIGMCMVNGILGVEAHVYKDLNQCIRHDKWDESMILLPIAMNSLVLLSIFSYVRSYWIEGGRFSWGILVMSAGMLVTNITIVLSARRLSKSYEIEMEQREAQKRSEAEYKYYSHLEAEQERIRLLYHDINNHISCIKEVAKGQSEITKYINALEKEVTITTEIYKTGCSVVDAILRQKSIDCDKERIQLRVNLDLRPCSFVSDKDLCSIFANAIDNAIESCQKIKDEHIKRYIYMESQVTQGFLIIKVKNSKEHNNEWVNNQLITQKKDKKLHGLGLKNIKRALENYNGEYLIKEDENEFYLKLVIPIKVKKCN